MSERRMALRPPKWKPRNDGEREKATKALEFFTRFLRFTKGKWAKQPFIPLDWEREQVIYPLFGRLRADGTRQYRSAWIEVGKKSGKSELAAGIGLRQLFADREPLAEVYIGAIDRHQPGRTFPAAPRMVH